MRRKIHTTSMNSTQLQGEVSRKTKTCLPNSYTSLGVNRGVKTGCKFGEANGGLGCKTKPTFFLTKSTLTRPYQISEEALTGKIVRAFSFLPLSALPLSPCSHLAGSLRQNPGVRAIFLPGIFFDSTLQENISPSKPLVCDLGEKNATRQTWE